MVVQHNLTAMNANRMLGITTDTQAKSTERLSSGYKINRAADDAAGLSISEKMRKQIRGLTQASSNAQDGISAVQTAEGALNEVQDMLQRMNELAVKAANGTNSEDDRSYIQQEVDQLVTEIDRVSTTTKFNESYLLKGVDKNGNVGKLTFDSAEAIVTGATFDQSGNATVAATAADQAAGAGQIGYKAEYVEINGKNYYYVHDGANATDADPTATPPTGVYAFADAKTAIEGADTDAEGVYDNLDEFEAAVKAAAATELKDVSYDTATKKITYTAFADVNQALDLSLHVGADSSKDNKIGLSIEMMSARYLAINGLSVSGDTAVAATASIDVIADALQKVSSQRSTLGAIQNRLEHTIKNLDNVVENTTSAESSIRDTDMASEMVAYSNNNILAQAGQAMLAQANQANSGVMSLLQ